MKYLMKLKIVDHYEIPVEVQDIASAFGVVFALDKALGKLRAAPYKSRDIEVEEIVSVVDEPT